MRTSIATTTAFAAAVAMAASIDQAVLESDKLRVIELAPGDRVSMTFEEMLNLKREGRGFIDVTDHLDVPTYAYSHDKVRIPTKLRLRDSESTDELLQQLSKTNLIETLEEFSSFYNRYAKANTGLESSMWLWDRVVEASDGREDVNVTLFDHDWPQKSVIARFEGASRPDEVVIVGAHQDSINLLMPTLLPAPGADDDGSGSMTILEVFRVLASSGWQPENTVEFQWYSAEELGLLGSQDIAHAYADANVNVKAMLEQDMTGYSAGSTRDGHPDEMGVFKDNADPDLTEFVKTVIDGYCEIGWVETECGYGCSDYVSWTNIAHAPAAFVSESSFDKFDPYIHTTEDKTDKLDFDHMVQHARLTLGFAIELGDAKL